MTSPFPSRISRRHVLLGTAVLGVLAGSSSLRTPAGADTPAPQTGNYEVTYSDAEWRQRLTPAQYDVLRQAGTEKPYTSPLNDEYRAGVFSCAGCALDLFSSNTKYDSHTGWPSFWQPIDNAVLEQEDRSLGIIRTEVHCRQCGGHLGHVIDDGPPPTGLRYCIDGVATTFRST